MNYTFNDKIIIIPDKEIDKLINSLEISKQDAIDLWLSDNGYEINEEQEALTKKAKDNKITATIHKAEGKTKERKKVERKPNPDKESLIAAMADFLNDLEGVDGVQVTNIGKLIEFNFNGKSMKIDLIEKRVKKD